MFLDILDQPVNEGDLIIHSDKMGSILGIVASVSPKAIHYFLLNRPLSHKKYFVRIKSRVLKVQLNSSTCKACYPSTGHNSIETWLDEHRRNGRSC